MLSFWVKTSGPKNYSMEWNGMWNKKKLMEWNGNGMKIDKTLWNGMEVEFKFSRFWITSKDYSIFIER
jgi:hypothetical protein